MKTLSSITRFNFDQRLQELIQNPKLLDQKETNLCGIVTALKIIIEKNPESFKILVAKIAKQQSAFGIFPNKKTLQHSTPNHFNPLEYHIFSSFRSTLNIFLGYNPLTDKGYHGFTWPGDISWMLHKFGINTKRRIVFNAIREIKKMQVALEQKQSIIGLFDWRGLMHGKCSFNEWHYIEIKNIEIDKDHIIILQIWNPNGGRLDRIAATQKYFKRSFWMWWCVEN